DDLPFRQVDHLPVSVVDGDVGELAVGRDGQLVRLGADVHAPRHLVSCRVNPQQLTGLVAAVPLDGDVDDVLRRRGGDAVRVRPDLDLADGLVRRHVDDGDVLAGAVGDVQLLPDLGGLGGTGERGAGAPQHAE